MIQGAPTESANATEILEWAVRSFGDRFAVVTSFQKEGMVILDMAWRLAGDRLRVITLDTGRLPAETYRMMETVRERYGVRIDAVSPDSGELEAMVRVYGPDLFYREAALRRLCCEVRKVRPLERKLAGLEAQAVGLRREQAETRASTPKLQQVNGKWKLSPLADWTAVMVEDYTRAHGVPVHPLYAQGYTSIGCAPCTRATAPGEGERAGRWWWESGTAGECGLHYTPGGRAARKVDVLLQEVLFVQA